MKIPNDLKFFQTFFLLPNPLTSPSFDCGSGGGGGGGSDVGGGQVGNM